MFNTVDFIVYQPTSIGQTILNYIILMISLINLNDLQKNNYLEQYDWILRKRLETNVKCFEDTYLHCCLMYIVIAFFSLLYLISLSGIASGNTHILLFSMVSPISRKTWMKGAH